VLDPAGLRIDLAEFLLGEAEDAPVSAESDGAGAGCALVQGKNGLHFGCYAPVFAPMIR
jgi:hypothetical protein